MSKTAWAAIIITVSLFGVLVWALVSNRDTTNYTKYDHSTYIEGNEDNGQIADHYKGSLDAKVVIIEYGDYQCPGCSSMSARMNVIAEDYGDDILFIFRQFPMSSIHPNARAAATAAEVAGLMGKYWEMHETIYSNQSEWSSANATDRTNVFASYAERIGLNKDEFRELYNSKPKEPTAKINFDTGIGKQAGVTGTPTFFLNGELLESSIWGKDEKFTAYINEKLGRTAAE